MRLWQCKRSWDAGLVPNLRYHWPHAVWNMAQGHSAKFVSNYYEYYYLNKEGHWEPAFYNDAFLKIQYPSRKCGGVTCSILGNRQRVTSCGQLGALICHLKHHQQEAVSLNRSVFPRWLPLLTLLFFFSGRFDFLSLPSGCRLFVWQASFAT